MLDQHTINLLERLVIATEEQNKRLSEIEKIFDEFNKKHRKMI